MTEVMIWANALLQIALVRTARQGARQLGEDTPSFSTTRTCAVSNGTGAAAAVVPSSAEIGSNDGYSRWPVTEMMVCFNAQFGCACDAVRRRRLGRRAGLKSPLDARELATKTLTCDTDRTKARTPKCRPAFGCSRRALPGPNKKIGRD